MSKLVTILLMLARTLGALLVLLGISIWVGFGGVTPVHAALGSLFVLDAWIIALIALFALPKRLLPLLVLALGGIVAWLGVAQTTLLVGSAHWAVRLVHLLLGLALLGLVESLGKAVRLHQRANDQRS
ncbi:MAG TPA: hypothetical protein VN706_10195 [Gemmatimonadaceae bacterium]|nr:hypothetical protein [Gemmatimonadaceae bacterium]